VWIRVRTPDGNYIEINRWQNLTVAPGETNTYYPVVQDIPESAPSGDYLYIAVCGQYPELIHSFYGPITVLAPLNGTELKQAWTVTDWIKQQPVEILPSVFSLSINFPNPFNAKTEIKYSVPYKSNIRIDVYNLQGQKVETLIDDLIESGNHSITWNASNYSSGIYFYRLTTGDRSFSKRMTLLK
ncbi:MAG: T9SS type A sorting domain-containing protein, partial [candidate division Zixibacteria bacterium]|nr:T9SS type A sorting domain-containing protein [candidate division Zixibacteria bacterium]